jgi:hypothetical protein
VANSATATKPSPRLLASAGEDSGWMRCPSCDEAIRAILIRERCPVCDQTLPLSTSQTRGPLRTRWDENLQNPRFVALMVSLLGLFQALVLYAVSNVGR